MTNDDKEPEVLGTTTLKVEDGDDRIFLRVEQATGKVEDGRKFDFCMAGVTVIIGIKDDDGYRTYVINLRQLVEDVLIIDGERE